MDSEQDTLITQLCQITGLPRAQVRGRKDGIAVYILTHNIAGSQKS